MADSRPCPGTLLIIPLATLDEDHNLNDLDDPESPLAAAFLTPQRRAAGLKYWLVLLVSSALIEHHRIAACHTLRTHCHCRLAEWVNTGNGDFMQLA